MPETMTIADVAREALEHFERRTRENGDTYETLKDSRPEWVQDLAREAHGRDHTGAPAMLPDDWRYYTLRRALDALEEAGDRPTDETADEFASECVDVYSSDRLAWLESHGDRAWYVDQACEELGAVDLGIIERIGLGQEREAREIFEIVVRELTYRI